MENSEICQYCCLDGVIVVSKTDDGTHIIRPCPQHPIEDQTDWIKKIERITGLTALPEEV